MQKGPLSYSGRVTVKGACRQPNSSTEPVLDPIIFAHETRAYQDEDKYSVFRWEFKRGGGERGKCNEWMERHVRSTYTPTVAYFKDVISGGRRRLDKRGETPTEYRNDKRITRQQQ